MSVSSETNPLQLFIFTNCIPFGGSPTSTAVAIADTKENAITLLLENCIKENPTWANISINDYFANKNFKDVPFLNEGLNKFFDSDSEKKRRCKLGSSYWDSLNMACVDEADAKLCQDIAEQYKNKPIDILNLYPRQGFTKSPMHFARRLRLAPCVVSPIEPFAFCKTK